MTAMTTKRDEKMMQDRRPAVAPAAALPRLLMGQVKDTRDQAHVMALDFQNNLIVGPIVSPPRWRPVPPS